jgi:hypothetical protein
VSDKNIVKEHNNFTNTNGTALSKVTNSMQNLENDKLTMPPPQAKQRKFTMINGN